MFDDDVSVAHWHHSAHLARLLWGEVARPAKVLRDDVSNAGQHANAPLQNVVTIFFQMTTVDLFKKKGGHIQFLNMQEWQHIHEPRKINGSWQTAKRNNDGLEQINFSNGEIICR